MRFGKLWRWGAIAESRAPKSGFIIFHFPRLGHPEWGGCVVETTTPARNDRNHNESIGGDDADEEMGRGEGGGDGGSGGSGGGR